MKIKSFSGPSGIVRVCSSAPSFRRPPSVRAPPTFRTGRHSTSWRWAGSFAESWAIHQHGADDPEDARQAYHLLKSDAVLAEVAAHRQPGEQLSDLARLYRSQKPGFGELVERVRVEREDVALGVVCKSLERAPRPAEAWKLVSPPILAESLEDRLEAYAALPADKADTLSMRLAELADVSDDLPCAYAGEFIFATELPD